MIDNEYNSIIELYINKIKLSLNNNLELIYIIGSSATNNVIVNWSDIDCIIVLNEYREEDIEIIKNISNNYDIKIGNTIYSKLEFESGIIDPKTYYYLLLYKENILKVQYKRNNLNIPNVDYDTCVEKTKTILTIDLHNCKRLLTYNDLNEMQLKSLFKKIYVIMKSLLIIGGYRPKNYYETFNLFHNVYDFDYFDYLDFIKKYNSGNVDILQLKKYTLKLIVFVINLLI